MATVEQVTYTCEFCMSGFVREKTLVSHACEPKRRWLNRDQIGNRLGFQSWLQFYAKNSMSKTKNKTYEEFIKNSFYTSFVKFGSYCSEVNVLNVSRYVDWLLKENVKITDWTSDKVYTIFLYDYLRKEDPFDAIHRSVEHCVVLAEDENIQPNDVLRYANPNKVCYAITTGKISPWLLYCSQSGSKFLDTLNSDQVKIVFEYINPEYWAAKFKGNNELTQKIKDTLNDAGY